MGPVAYPWGFPVLLAPVYAVFGLNVMALKSVDVLCFLLFLLVVWKGFQRYHALGWRVVLFCLFAFNPTLLRFVDQIAGDIPFLLLSTISLLLIGRLVIEKRDLISPGWDRWILGGAMAGAFAIRSNGILLPATLALTQVISALAIVYQADGPHDRLPGNLARVFSMKQYSRRDLVLLVLPYASFTALVVAWRLLLPEGDVSVQTGQFASTTMGAIRQNVDYYLDLPGEFFQGVPHAYLIYGATIPLAIAGAIRRYRFDYHALIYLVLTMLLYVVYPTTGGLRYVFPILPFYLSFVVSCLEDWTAARPYPWRALRTSFAFVSVLIVLACFGRESARGALANLSRDRIRPSGPFTDTSADMFSFIVDHTETDSTVVFFKPRAMRMMTGRRAVKLYKVGDLSRADYLTLFKPDEMRDQVAPDDVRCMTEMGAIEPVYRNVDFVVYRIVQSHKNAMKTNLGCATPTAPLRGTLSSNLDR